MRVKIKANGRRVTIPVPYSMLGNGLILRALSGAVQNTEVPLTPQQMRMLIDGLREAKGNFGALTLVDVLSADGDTVTVTL